MKKQKTISGLFHIIILTLALSSFYSVSYASVPDADTAVDVQSDVESLKANLDDAEGGFANSGKELAQAQTDLVIKTDENRATVSKLTSEIKSLNAQQLRNTNETARLTANIVKLNNEIKSAEASHAKVQAKAEIVKAKLTDTKASYDQSTANRQKAVGDLKIAQSMMQKTSVELKAKQHDLKVALSKESASAIALKKADASLKMMQAKASVESKKIDQQIKMVVAKAEQNEKKSRIAAEKRMQQELMLKQKRQKLSDAKLRLKKSTQRIGSN